MYVHSVFGVLFACGASFNVEETGTIHEHTAM